MRGGLWLNLSPTHRRVHHNTSALGGRCPEGLRQAKGARAPSLARSSTYNGGRPAPARQCRATLLTDPDVGLDHVHKPIGGLLNGQAGCVDGRAGASIERLAT
jgi:hypothetical protein